MAVSESTKQWAAERFGIDPDEILFYNSGSCYDRIEVKSKEAADKVTATVKGERANGGMFHGMPLGGQEKTTNGYEVYC